MPRLAVKFASERVIVRGLVVRRASLGDADTLLQLFTDSLGIISVSARNARRSNSKLGALEPIHALRAVVALRSNTEIGTLIEASIERARLGILAHSERLEWAFRMLLWVRRTLPINEPEPSVFLIVDSLFDLLDVASPSVDPRLLRGHVLRAGLQMSKLLGYGSDLDSCVTCRRCCPANSSAFVDASGGGIICRACGGASSGAPLVRRTLLSSLRALSRGGTALVEAVDEPMARLIIERSFPGDPSFPVRGANR